ncbi:MAG: type II secretion system protein [Planctomycetes bacterium]|nr:type II secretion system protein [Planctomycetota bacterium]
MIRTSTTQLGFTILELLVTITLIVILVSAMVIGMNSARTAAQIAETSSRLMAMKQATVWFKEEIGYLPPVLDDQRNLKSVDAIGQPLRYPVLPVPDDQEQYRSEVQEWYSITSPADYLLGYGDVEADGFGRLPQAHAYYSYTTDQMPRLGITHPGVDGVWRGTDIHIATGVTGYGLFTDRKPRGDLPIDPLLSEFPVTSKVYGPYLDVNNDQMLGRLVVDSSTGETTVDPVTGKVKVYYPGEPDYDVSQPMVIVDSWGTPIRYYRPVYPNFEIIIGEDPNLQNGIAKRYPPSNDYGSPTLSDYLVLRPFDFPPDKVVDGFLSDFRDGNTSTGDTSTSIALQTGQFAYFSSGPDQKLNQRIRADVTGLAGNVGDDATDESNKDNMVEVGP